jgi:hypothetical protein
MLPARACHASFSNRVLSILGVNYSEEFFTDETEYVIKAMANAVGELPLRC